jgi:hypothetical protein
MAFVCIVKKVARESSLMSVAFPDIIVTFAGYSCTLEASRYAETGNVALLLLVEKTGAPYATASVNPEASLPDDRVAIKDYSENKGVAEALVKAGVLGEEDDAYELPFPVYKLRIPLPAGLVSKATILAMK